MLKAECISVTVAGRQIVDDVSFHLHEGEWLMLTGPNGAGKTTLIRALSGGIGYSGKAELMGQDVAGLSALQRARMMGVLMQINSLSADFTVEDVVAMGRYAYRRGIFSKPDGQETAKVEEALALVGMTDMRRQRVLSLSGGERQRMLLAQVLCQDPAVLVLDEPANHLDLPYQRQLLMTVDHWRRQKGRAVISVVHDLTMARRWGTHALLMDSGKCVGSGPAREVLTPETLAVTYRMDIADWVRKDAEAWQDA